MTQLVKQVNSQKTRCARFSLTQIRDICLVSSSYREFSSPSCLVSPLMQSRRLYVHRMAPDITSRYRCRRRNDSPDRQKGKGARVRLCQQQCFEGTLKQLVDNPE